MINTQDIDPLVLPFVVLEERSRLPTTPCIYFAIDDQNVVHYVGRALNPRQRWKQHHLYKRLSAMNNIRIAYLWVDNPELLSDLEWDWCFKLKPELNKCIPHLGVRGEKQWSNMGVRTWLKNTYNKKCSLSFEVQQTLGKIQ